MSGQQQGSAAWHQARLGKVTASRIADVTARKRNGWGISRTRYMEQLIHERLTGEITKSYVSDAMQWGLDTEPLARKAYASCYEAKIVQTGFIDHPHLAGSGASPDGLVGTGGLLEIKCPNSETHLNMRERNHVPLRYLKQMQWQMACTKRQWCDFVSFDPRLGEQQQMYVKRIYYDDLIPALEQDVVQFLVELEAILETIRAERA